MRKILMIAILFMLLFATGITQYSKKSSKANNPPNKGNVFQLIINTILGGPHDVPISTRLLNKAGQFISIIIGGLGSLFAYLKFFRNRKSRSEKIDQFIAQQKAKFALGTQQQMKKIDKKAIDLKMYAFNEEKDRTIAIKSSNDSINFNIDIMMEEVDEHSPLIYDLLMKGNDPQGKSVFTGFVTFKDDLMEIRLEQTYETQDRNKQIPICFFEGRQIKKQQNILQGEWWRDKQKGTKGSYSGRWTFTF